MAPHSPERTRGETAQYVVDELIRRGVRVNPSSRLGTYARKFAANAYSGPFGPNDQELLCEAVVAARDIHEVALVLDTFPRLDGAALQRLVEDAPVPRLDHATPGRDRQAELHAAAICELGKMTPRVDREPDLWCEASSTWFGLAVKRVRSEKQFEANLALAVDQIAKCDLMYGLVVMDVSLAWNPDVRAIVTQRSDEEIAFDLRERISRLLHANNGALGRAWERTPKALGLICLDVTFVFRQTDGWTAHQFSTLCLSPRNNRHTGRLAIAFRNGWNAGCSGCVTLDHVPRTGVFAGPPVDRILALRPPKD